MAWHQAVRAGEGSCGFVRKDSNSCGFSEERAYASYCGNFRIEDGRLITRVDAAALRARIGGDEVREVELNGNRLVLRPPRRADGAQRILSWEREGPP